jgi:beta-galactosidase
VRQGGTLFLGPRSGMKDEFNSLNPQRQPGPLVEALGAKVEQYYALEKPIMLTNPDHPAIPITTPGTLGTADTWAEQLSVSSPATEINMIYGDPGGWLDGKPAMVSRAIGGGHLTYLGTLPDTKLLRTFLRLVSPEVPKLSFPGQDEVEECTRSGVSGSVSIYINHGVKAVSIPLQHPMRDLLSPIKLPVSEIALPPQGVAVLIPEPTQ